MPAGAGSYGRHGIWQFGEEDTGPDISSTLNKLSTSVMDALDDRDDDRAVITARRTVMASAITTWMPFPWQAQTTYGTGLAMPVNDGTFTAARPMLVQISARVAINTTDQIALQLELNGAPLGYAQDVRGAAGTPWAAAAINVIVPLSSGARLRTLYRLFSGSSAPLITDQCFLSVTELRSLA